MSSRLPNFWTVKCHPKLNHNSSSCYSKKILCSDFIFDVYLHHPLLNLSTKFDVVIRILKVIRICICCVMLFEDSCEEFESAG